MMNQQQLLNINPDQKKTKNKKEKLKKNKQKIIT